MALTDDIQRLVTILVRQHQDGLAQRLRYRAYGLGDGAGLGHVAGACGVSPAELHSWEVGLSTPTASEGLAWLAHLYERQPRPARASVLEQARRAVAERDARAAAELDPDSA